MFSQKILSKSLICSIFMSNLSDSLMVAHLSWATWAIRSRSLICLERPERFAHSCSFVLSNLSESLTVAHLIWAKWTNEGTSDERISVFPALLLSTCPGLFHYQNKSRLPPWIIRLDRQQTVPPFLIIDHSPTYSDWDCDAINEPHLPCRIYLHNLFTSIGLSCPLGPKYPPEYWWAD